MEQQAKPRYVNTASDRKAERELYYFRRKGFVPRRLPGGLSDRMFVVAMVARPALCARRGLRWIGRRRASHIGDEPWDRIARFMSVWIPRS